MSRVLIGSLGVLAVLLASSVLAVSPVSAAPGVALPNCIEGNWTSYIKVYNMTSLQNTGDPTFVAVDSNGTVYYGNDNGPGFVNRVFLNQTAGTFYGAKWWMDISGAVVSAYGTYMISGATGEEQVNVFKSGVGLQNLSVFTEAHSTKPILFLDLAISADGRFIAAAGPISGEPADPRLVLWEATGTAPLKCAGVTGACPSDQWMIGVSAGKVVCSKVPTGSGPSSCIPSLGYVCQTSTTNTTTSSSFTSGGPPPPASQLPYYTPVLGVTFLALGLIGLFVYGDRRKKRSTSGLLGNSPTMRSIRMKLREWSL